MAIMHLYSSSLVSVHANCGALAEAYSHGYLQNFRKQKIFRRTAESKRTLIAKSNPAQLYHLANVLTSVKLRQEETVKQGKMVLFLPLWLTHICQMLVPLKSVIYEQGNFQKQIS